MANPHIKPTQSILPLDSDTACDLEIVLHALLTLQICCVEWHHYIKGLPAECRIERSSNEQDVSWFSGVELLPETAGILRAIDRMAREYALLQSRVIPFDRILFGHTIESLSELVLRGQMFVVLLCVHRIQDLLPPRSQSFSSIDPARKILRNHFGTARDFARYVELELQRITSIWFPLRFGNHPAVNAGELSREHMCRIAVQTAQREMNALLRTPRIGEVLNAGVESQMLPELRTPCARMTIALQVHLVAEPDLRLLREHAIRALARPRTPLHPLRA